MSGVIGRTIAGADIVNALVNGGIVLPPAVLPPATAPNSGLTIAQVNDLIAAAIVAAGIGVTPTPGAAGNRMVRRDGSAFLRRDGSTLLHR